MRTSWLVFPVLIFCLQICSGQNQEKIDSLLQELQSLPQDTSRLHLLGKLCIEFQRAGQFDNQVKYGEEMKKLAQKLISESSSHELIYVKKMLGNAYMTTARAYRALGDYDKALDNGLMAKKIYEEMDSMALVAPTLDVLANVTTDKGDMITGMKYQEEAISIYKKLGNKKELGRSLVNYGVSYIILGNYSEAMKSELAALKILEQIDDKDWLGTCYINLGVINRNLGNFEEALKNYEKVLEITKETGDKFNSAAVHNSLGAVYGDMKKYDTALINYHIALREYEAMSNLPYMVRVNYNIAGVYNLTGNQEQAVKVLLQALKQAEEIGNKELLSYVYSALATNYSELNRYAEAIDYFNKAITLGIEMQSYPLLRESYHGMSNAYKQKGDYKNAYKYYELYFQTNDSVYNETKSQQIAEMTAKYESEKKDGEILLLNKDKEIAGFEIRKQKWIKNGSFAAIALLVILIILGYRTYSTRQSLKLQTLRNKIASDLHDDVGSTLSSISIFSEMARQQSSEVAPMLEQIGDSSRKMLDAMADIVWTIHPENDQFEKIIERMRSFAYELLGAKKIDFEFEASEEASKVKLPMDVRKNLYLIFKEATNNMVKYSEANRAKFSISRTKNNLTMLIRDNGKGFDVNQHSQGNGIKNMKRRAEEIKAELLIESEPGNGTTVQLLLNVA